MPVINENDTVATNEIRYGDNDRLAARVATMASADLLVLLSDVDGLYDAPPGAATRRPSWCRWSSASRRRSRRWPARPAPSCRAAACRPRSRPARSRPHGGTHMVIASGRVAHPLAAIATARAAPGSSRPANPVTARKKWIAGSLEPKGALTIDAGAVAALRRGRSLLPAGVNRIDGGVRARRRGGHPRPRRREIGRGLVAYDAEDADSIKGRSSGDILSILGFAGRAEMVHRDDLVVGRE